MPIIFSSKIKINLKTQDTKSFFSARTLKLFLIVRHVSIFSLSEVSKQSCVEFKKMFCHNSNPNNIYRQLSWFTISLDLLTQTNIGQLLSVFRGHHQQLTKGTYNLFILFWKCAFDAKASRQNSTFVGHVRYWSPYL